MVPAIDIWSKDAVGPVVQQQEAGGALHAAPLSLIRAVSCHGAGPGHVPRTGAAEHGPSLLRVMPSPSGDHLPLTPAQTTLRLSRLDGITITITVAVLPAVTPGDNFLFTSLVGSEIIQEQ